MGIDIDASTVATSTAQGRKAIIGDATDPEFWSRADGLIDRLEWVLLTMSVHGANVAAVSRLRSRGFTGRIAATSTYPDDAQELRDLGAGFAFDVFSEAGTGFASGLAGRMLNGTDPPEAPESGTAGAKGAER